MIIDKKSHLFRLMQPLPLFIAFIARQLNFDVQVEVTKPNQTAGKRSVNKVKVTPTSGDDAESEALKGKIEKSIQQYDQIEFSRGWIQIKKSKKAKKDTQSTEDKE